MALTLEEKLSAMTANRNALKEEIAGLHLYINKLLLEMGKTPKFNASQQGTSPDENIRPACLDCGEKYFHAKTNLSSVSLALYEDKIMKFRVDWEAEINNEKMSGVESEASWFLVDQQGKMYSYGPMEPIRPISKEYTKCVPLFQVGDEWLSFDEIEKRITNR